jgi:hypothetical protein
LGLGELVEGIADRVPEGLRHPRARVVELLEEIAHGLAHGCGEVALVSPPEAPRLGAEATIRKPAGVEIADRVQQIAVFRGLGLVVANDAPLVFHQAPCRLDEGPGFAHLRAPNYRGEAVRFGPGNQMLDV